VNVRKVLLIDLGWGSGMNIFSNFATAPENTITVTNITLLLLLLLMGV
jgi:hypothetical protein